MSSRQTALVLLSIWLLATVGCSWWPSRGNHRLEPGLSPDPADLRLPDPAAAQPSSGTPQPAYQQPVAGNEPLGAGSAGPSDRFPVQASQPAVPPNVQSAVPVAEMSTFIHELEAATHIDPATRSQILATAFQTPPQWQPQLIRQYRALLALGRTSLAASSPESVTIGQPPTAATTLSPPQVPGTEPRPATVVAASHNEPVESEEVEAAANPEKSSDLERQLEALLREMKHTKVEAAAFTTVDDASESLSGPASKSDDRPIAKDASWQQFVESAIEKLEQQRERQLDSNVREEDEARLRLLYLIADRRDDAVRAIASLEPEMQEFWSKQFFGLATLLNPELITDRSNRLIESKRNLDEAIRRLGESAPLFVRNLAFITSVDSYGAYTPFDDYNFQPGQAVLLYAEVENFCCKETARGYHTSLRSSYEIFDSSRQKVADHEFSTNDEYCKNARRDFFTVCEFRMPEKLQPGKYELRLTVADLNGDKAGESSITFHIRGES
ncbi:MAG: hypothetical protein GXX96_00155 [Planctomycetaceae bacterium]|nr:hypothetical protein [Planctomycetaceae bacterium]